MDERETTELRLQRADCPQCGSARYVVERSPTGVTKCTACGYSAPHRDWPWVAKPERRRG